MAHSYRKVVDDERMLKYEKRHDNGEKTTVQADKVGTLESGGTSWLANVKDPNGSQRLGKFDTKAKARKAMTRWMRNNPKGVGGSNGGGSGAVGAMNAIDEGATNIFTGGGLFK